MRHLIQRFGFYLIALWGSVTLNFLIPRLSPGSPVDALLARMHGRISPAAQHALEIQYGVSKDPLFSQYLQYIGNLLHGNLGTSFANAEPVTNVIARDLPWTLVLVGLALIISFVVGTILGVAVAWWRGSTTDTILMPAFTFISAIPYFWFALALVFVLGYTLNWFPSYGGYDIYSYTPSLDLGFLLSAARYAILPAFTIVVGSIAGWMIGMRNTHDHHALRGLRADGRSQRANPLARDDDLRRPQRDLAQHYKLRALARLCGQRLAAHRGCL